LANGNLTSLSVYKTGISASKRLFYTLKHAFNREALIVAAISVFSEINICFVLEIDSNLIG